MHNWKNYRNFRKYENADGSFTYIITVDGVNVEVSAEIYKAYAQGGYKMENMELSLKRDRVQQDSNGRAIKDEYGQAMFLSEREVSLEKLASEGWACLKSEASAEDIFFDSKFSDEEELVRCLTLLTGDERALIQALFYKGLTEREYAKIIGLSKTALHSRKIKVLAKIKNFIMQ